MAVGDANIDGIEGFFDQAFILSINNQVVASPAETYGASEADYFIFDTTAETTYSGILVNWLHMFFSEERFVRVIYTFTNQAATPVTFNADIQSNLGSNEKTLGMYKISLSLVCDQNTLIWLSNVCSDEKVESTSSGDKEFNKDDRWVITYNSDCATSYYPATTAFFLFANDSQVAPSFASLNTTFECHGTEGIRVVFPLTLQPGENVSLTIWSFVAPGNLSCG